MFRSSPQAGKKSLGSMRNMKNVAFFLLTPNMSVGALALLPPSACPLHAGPEHPQIWCSHQLCAFRGHCVHVWPALCYFAALQLPWRRALFRTIWFMNLGPCSFLLILTCVLNNQQVVIPKGFCKPQFSPKTTLITDSSEVVTSILPQGNKIYQNLLLIL